MYDYKLKNEVILKEFEFNSETISCRVKIASICTGRGTFFYGIADTGEPVIKIPFWRSASEAIESIINDLKNW